MMAFTERLRAERALQSSPDTDDLDSVEWRSTATRIRDARAKRGLDEADVADQLEMSVESYVDLESYDDEAFTVARSAIWSPLGRILHVEPRVLLLGSELEGARRSVTFKEIAEGLSRRLATSGVAADALSQEIGYDIEPLLASADALWDYNVDGLYTSTASAQRSRSTESPPCRICLAPSATCSRSAPRLIKHERPALKPRSGC